MTVLEETIEGVKNYNIAVKKRGDDITFLRRIVRGGADDSYGIEVAKLAGVPDSIINRAKEILKELIAAAPQKSFERKEEEEPLQMTLAPTFDDSVTEKLRSIDVNTLTPIEAMNLLYELKRMVED